MPNAVILPPVASAWNSLVDLLVRRAARLQDVDAELGAVERLARLDAGGAAGACPNCDALYPRGAAFCSQCAHRLMARV